MKPQTNKLNLNKYNDRQLNLRVIKGRAFIGLDTFQQDPTSTLQIHVKFGSNRYTSEPVMSDIEPTFNFSTMLKLPSRDLNLLLDIEELIHIVVTIRDINGITHAVGVAKISWQKIFCSGRISQLIELKEQSHSQMSVGVLDTILELMPDSERIGTNEFDFFVFNSH